MRRFTQAAVVAAAMSVPVFAGAMIGSVPQAHANCVSQRGAEVPGGFARACGLTPQLAKTVKEEDRAAGNKASGSQTAFGNFPNPKH
jgi:hypothetical protein